MSIQEHILRKDNPHGVTKDHIGLGNLMDFPVASVAEIISLSATDRYIRASDIDQVNGAFTQYLQDIGLMDENGEIIRSPIDTLGETTFDIASDGTVTLNGTHPTAHSVDIKVTQAGAEVFSQSDIMLANEAWAADVSTLILDPDLAHNLVTIYRDVDGNQISRADTIGGKIPLIDGGTIGLIINSVDSTGTLYGNTPGAVTVDVTVKENGSLIYSGTNISVDADNEYFWSVDSGDVVYDPSAEHEIIVIANDANDSVFGQHSIIGSNIATVSEGEPVNFGVGINGIGTLDGYIPGAVRVSVTILQDTNTVFGDSNVPTNPANGYWTVDLTTVTFDRNREIVAIVEGFDADDNLIYRGTESADKEALDPDQGALVTYDEGQDVYYYDFRNFSNWEGVAASWIDYGQVGDQ